MGCQRASLYIDIYIYIPGSNRQRDILIAFAQPTHAARRDVTYTAHRINTQCAPTAKLPLQQFHAAADICARSMGLAVRLASEHILYFFSPRLDCSRSHRVCAPVIVFAHIPHIRLL